MIDPYDYFTVLVPPVPVPFQTEWHASDGQTLTRGAFASEDDAIRWARAHLSGTPYSVAHCIFDWTEVPSDELRACILKHPHSPEASYARVEYERRLGTEALRALG